MEELGLAESVETLRSELADSVDAARDASFHFPVTGIELEFHVAVRKEGTAGAKVKVWVVEAGASGTLAREEIHKVTISLGPPTAPDGTPIKITRGSSDKP